jgi:hypothetical protein
MLDRHKRSPRKDKHLRKGGILYAAVTPSEGECRELGNGDNHFISPDPDEIVKLFRDRTEVLVLEVKGIKRIVERKEMV